MPFWIAWSLFKWSVLNLGEPTYFSNGFKAVLDADPLVVNLMEKSPYFYDMANMIFPTLEARATWLKIPGIV